MPQNIPTANKNMENPEVFWEKFLSQGEELKYGFSVSKEYRQFAATFSAIAGAMLLFTPGYFLGIIIAFGGIFYFYYFLEWSNKYAFTNSRILIYRGWITSQLISIDYDKITEIVVEEPMLDKMARSGDLFINTAGAGLQQEKEAQKIEHVPDPYEIKKKLDEIRSSKK